MPELVFVHVPKTAGMALRRRLCEVYEPRWPGGLEKSLFRLLGLRLDLGDPLDLWHVNRPQSRRVWGLVLGDMRAEVNRMPCVIGHVPVELVAPVYRVVTATVLRDPPARLLSDWCYSKRIGQSVPDSPFEFAELPHRKDMQTQLTGDDLNAFDVVGVAEKMQAFLNCLVAAMNWPPRLRRKLDRVNDGDADPLYQEWRHLSADSGWRDHVAKHHPLDTERYLKVKERWK